MRSVLPIVVVLSALAALAGCILPGPGTDGVVFDFSGAVGLVSSNRYYREPPTGIPRGYSSMYKMLADGSIESALVSGSMDGLLMFPAANGRLYFTSGPGLLFETSRSTGIASTLGPGLGPDYWKSLGSTWHRAVTPAVQVDAARNVYFWAGDEAGGYLLMKHHGGSAAVLMKTDPGIQVMDYVVRSDGNVIVMGSDIANDTGWLKRVAADGTISDILQSGAAFRGEFLREFPNGAVYAGFAGQGGYAGVHEIFPNDTIGPDFALDFSAVPGARLRGAEVLSFIWTSKVYAVDPFDRLVYEYWPTQRRLPTSVWRFYAGCAVGNNLVISGLDGNLHFRTVLYDTDTDTEVDLLPARHVQMSMALYLPGQDWVVFAGTDYSTGRPVFGRIDLGRSNEVRMETLADGEEYIDLLPY